jgi:hypothetical protein
MKQSLMKAEHLESQFVAMGARLKIQETRPRWVPRTTGRPLPPDYAIDIRRDRAGEFFELRVSELLRESLDATVLQATPRDRHLLLLVRQLDGQGTKDRFLCGHDEREWFVAAVPGNASSVLQAKLALRPHEVIAAQARAGLSARQADSRNNRAFRRQGEWFFVPAPGLQADPKLVLRNEPIRRGGGKAHMVEELFRTGGIRVHVCSMHPNGLTDDEHRDLIRRRPEAKRWGWRIMVRDAGVYARGRIRHPDHACIMLHDWHRVLMNTESQTRSMQNMAFLD